MAYLAGGVTAGDQFQHLDLAPGQRRLACIEHVAMAQQLAGDVEELGAHVRVDGGAAVGNAADGGGQALERRVLAEVTVDAGLDPAEQILLGLARRQQDDASVRRHHRDLLHHVEPGEPGHQDVEHHHVRLQRLRLGDGGLGVGRLTHHLETGVGERGAQAGPEQRDVIYDEDLRHAGSMSPRDPSRLR